MNRDNIAAPKLLRRGGGKKRLGTGAVREILPRTRRARALSVGANIGRAYANTCEGPVPESQERTFCKLRAVDN